ncbi:hypothetical protein LCGC14_1182660 [marine sediment metagenome]|uniref:Lipoprotein n=2 Tax=root TaxID=1 RepID=A0A831QTY8_9FLAO|nr:hypothetical protein [Pricia antarctica]
MRRVFYILIILLALSCEDDNGGGKVGGCAPSSSTFIDRLSDKSSNVVVTEELVIEYVDALGTNLIENKTYNPGDISLYFKNNTRTDVVDLQNEETRYMLRVSGFSEGKNRFNITLSNTEIDTMELFATEVDFSPCTGPAFAIDSVFYNGEKRKLITTSDCLKKLTITK